MGLGQLLGDVLGLGRVAICFRVRNLSGGCVLAPLSALRRLQRSFALPDPALLLLEPFPLSCFLLEAPLFLLCLSLLPLEFHLPVV